MTTAADISKELGGPVDDAEQVAELEHLARVAWIAADHLAQPQFIHGAGNRWCLGPQAEDRACLKMYPGGRSLVVRWAARPDPLAR
jgi:hypothetical protein